MVRAYPERRKTKVVSDEVEAFSTGHGEMWLRFAGYVVATFV
jgi:hypothetical protein